MQKFQLKQNSYGGKIIVFEGIDGSGKTTLINFLKEYLTNKGFDVVYLKMPSDRMRNLKIFDDYDNSKDDTVRKTIDLTNLTIMVSGDRLLQQDEIIIPALKQNKVVICDRYCYTGYVRCAEPIIQQLSQRFLQPDLCFLCDCEVETAKKRIDFRKAEANNYYDKNEVNSQRERFLELAEKNDFEIINTDFDIEVCKQKIANCVDKKLTKQSNGDKI